MTILLGVAYLGLYAQPGDSLDVAEGSAGPVPVVTESPATASLDPVDALAASEGVAFHHMVQAMDSVAREHRVFDVPAAWLEPEYLADASAHPQVGSYWVRYLVFVRDLRREDERLFRRSFVTRMADLDVSPSVLSLRLAQALGSFHEGQPEWERLYDHMEDLARAGIEFHRLLVERDRDLEYVPPDEVHTARRSRGTVSETVRSSRAPRSTRAKATRRRGGCGGWRVSGFDT